VLYIYVRIERYEAKLVAKGFTRIYSYSSGKDVYS